MYFTELHLLQVENLGLEYEHILDRLKVETELKTKLENDAIRSNEQLQETTKVEHNISRFHRGQFRG